MAHNLWSGTNKIGNFTDRIHVMLQTAKYILEFQTHIMVLDLINSQASDQKSNPHVSDLPRTAVSLKTLSQGSENLTNVFAGAETHNSTLKFEIYIRNSEKLINFF